MNPLREGQQNQITNSYFDPLEGRARDKMPWSHLCLESLSGIYVYLYLHCRRIFRIVQEVESVDLECTASEESSYPGLRSISCLTFLYIRCTNNRSDVKTPRSHL